MSGGKVIAVWGPPGSGKSAVSAKLARRLTERGHDTVLLLCGMTAPMLPCICPPSEIARRRSLGSVFAAARITPVLVKNNLTTLNCSDNLSLLGLQKGESEHSYPPCSERLASELMRSLRELAEFTIADCTPRLEPLALAALEQADAVLRLVSGELKSASYYSSQLPALKARLPDIDAHIRAANAPRPLRVLEQVSNTLSKTEFRLPCCPELERQCSDGNLLSELKGKDSKAFTREIEKIVERLEAL